MNMFGSPAPKLRCRAALRKERNRSRGYARADRR